MKNHTKEVNKKRLEEVVDSLTEENKRCFLGIMEALAFAQTVNDTAGKETADSGVKCHAD
ncbi:MAG: hypothetical protein LBD31_06930 [Treponema sp.]|jgi:hypothetical protein|nr:hypothetical protein [Treponema sp.]